MGILNLHLPDEDDAGRGKKTRSTSKTTEIDKRIQVTAAAVAVITLAAASVAIVYYNLYISGGE